MSFKKAYNNKIKTTNHNNKHIVAEISNCIGNVKGDDSMQHFIPFKPEKEVISIRLNTELLKNIDAAAENAQISRNEFINQCIIFAMEHLESDKDQ